LDELIKIRDIKNSDIPEICSLIMKVFMANVASYYTEKGIKEFEKITIPEKTYTRIENGVFMLVAENQNNEIVGVIEIRNKSHVSRLFVDVDYQRCGIARRLFQAAIDEYILPNKVAIITVNSSPNAQDAYQHLGFVRQGEASSPDNGIISIPMKFSIV